MIWFIHTLCLGFFRKLTMLCFVLSSSISSSYDSIQCVPLCVIIIPWHSLWIDTLVNVDVSVMFEVSLTALGEKMFHLFCLLTSCLNHCAPAWCMSRLFVLSKNQSHVDKIDCLWLSTPWDLWWLWSYQLSTACKGIFSILSSLRMAFGKNYENGFVGFLFRYSGVLQICSRSHKYLNGYSHYHKNLNWYVQCLMAREGGMCLCHPIYTCRTALFSRVVLILPK